MQATWRFLLAHCFADNAAPGRRALGCLAPVGRAFPAAVAVLALALCLGAQPARIDPELKLLLTKSLPFAMADLQRAEQGQPVVVPLPSDSEKDIGFAGLVWLDGRPSRFLDEQRTMRENAGTKSMSEAGRFGIPPHVDDLRTLRLEPKDLEALATCRAGNCNIKLFRRDIAEIAALSERERTDEKTLTVAYRKALIRAVDDYKVRGNRALGDYADKAEAVDAAAEFDALLRETPFVALAAPDLDRYLRRFPDSKPPHGEDIFYWSKISFGLKPTVRANHMILYKNPDNPKMPWVIASKQIYAAHYLQAALELRFLVVPEGHQGNQGYYLLTLSRSRNDGLEGFWHGIVRAIVRSRARVGVQSYLAFTQERLGRLAKLEVQDSGAGTKAESGQ